MGQNLMLAVCEMSQSKGYSHFFYGAAPEVPVLLAEKLKAKFPKLNVVGGFSPPFRPLTPKEDEKDHQID